MAGTEHDGPGTADGDGRDPLTRRIAISLAAVVLLGASLAVLQTDASVHESTSARETTRAAVRAMRANVTDGALLELESELVAERDFLSYRRPLTTGAASLAEATGLPRDRAAIDHGLQEAAEGLPLERSEKALERIRYETHRATLTQQALATTRIAWNTRSTQYTTAIAVLAAALFLVGFGLIVQGRVRIYSYALGLTLAAVVALAGVWLYLLAIPETPPEAIELAARGEALRESGDLEGALGAYDRAIAVDDAYPPAYRGRAIARLLDANPDYPVTRAFTDATGPAAERAREDIERALDLEDGRDFLALGAAALRAFHAGEYEDAVELADRAIEINPDVPDVHLLRSAASAALGEAAAARSSLDAALDLLRDSEPTRRNRLLASTYLSYLEWVAARVPARADTAKALAGEAAASETALTLGRVLSLSAPTRGSVAVRALRYVDGRLTVALEHEGLPAGTALTALVYERPLRGGAWAQPTDLALFADVAGDGVRRFSIPLERTCEPTEVRVDVYLDGAPVRSATGPGVAPTC